MNRPDTLSDGKKAIRNFVLVGAAALSVTGVAAATSEDPVRTLVGSVAAFVGGIIGGGIAASLPFGKKPSGSESLSRNKAFPADRPPGSPSAKSEDSYEDYGDI